MKLFVFLTLSAITLSGCGKSPEELYKQGEDAEKVQDYAAAIEHYTRFMDDYASHELAEKAAFNIARIHNNDTRDFDAAIRGYHRYVELYPDGEKAAVSMFLIGYLHHNALNNLDSARGAYERFIEKYPDHEMALSAQFELDNLGKPAESLLPEPATKEIQQGKSPPKVAAKPQKK